MGLLGRQASNEKQTLVVNYEQLFRNVFSCCVTAFVLYFEWICLQCVLLHYRHLCCIKLGLPWCVRKSIVFYKMPYHSSLHLETYKHFVQPSWHIGFIFDTIRKYLCLKFQTIMMILSLCLWIKDFIFFKRKSKSFINLKVTKPKWFDINLTNSFFFHMILFAFLIMKS